MNFSFDYYHNLEDIDFTLCNPDGKDLYALQVVDRNLTLRFNDLSSLSFTVFSKITLYDGKNIDYNAYNYVQTKRLVRVDKIGWFQIVKVSENDNGVIKTKSVECESLEAVLKNIGVVSEERVYCFYNPADPFDRSYRSEDKSAVPSVIGQLYNQIGIKQDLHSSFEWEPATPYSDWTVTYITKDLIYDGSSEAKCRSLSSGTTFAYDWLKNTIQDAFGVIILFDFLNKAIRVVSADEITAQSDVIFTFSNFVKEMHIEEDASEIVTVLNCKGGNDCDIRMVNPVGTNYICNFDYYKYDGWSQESEWMSPELTDVLNDWEEAVEGNTASFEENERLYHEKLEAIKDIRDGKLKETSVRCNDLNNASGQYTEYYADETHDPTDSELDGFVAVERVYIGDTSIDMTSVFDDVAITQDTYVRAYKNAPTYESGRWLFDGAYQYKKVSDLCSVDITLIDKEPTPEYLYFSDGSSNTQNYNSFCKLNAKATMASRGNITFANLPTPSEYNVGTVYTVTDSFTTDSRFIEGAGELCPAGTIVAIVSETEDGTDVYYYTYTDVFLYTCDGFTRFVAFNGLWIDRHDDVVYQLVKSDGISSASVDDEDAFHSHVRGDATPEMIRRDDYLMYYGSDNVWHFGGSESNDLSTWGITASFSGDRDPLEGDSIRIFCTPLVQYWFELQEKHANMLQGEIDELQLQADLIRENIEYIQSQCDLTNYFLDYPELYKELRNYWIEGEYSNDKIALLDTMTVSEQVDLERELYEAAKVELAKVSQPRISFSIDAIDATKLYEFQHQMNELVLGRRVYVEHVDGEWYSPALLQISLNLDTTDSFSLEFANALSLNDWGYTYADLIAQSSSVSRQVSENWYEITNYDRDKEKIDSIIKNPLDMTLRAGLSNLTNQNFTVNDNGILGRKALDGGGFDPEQVRMINNLIVFTDDGWKTAKTALGKIYYTDDQGVVHTSYGLAAETIIGQLVIGSKMEIKDETGRISIGGGGINVNDNFIVDASGNVTLNGSIQWGTGSSPTQVVYSRTNMISPPQPGTKWEDFYPEDAETWHQRFDEEYDVYASYTYNGGGSWTTPIKVVAKDGTSIAIKASADDCTALGDGYVDSSGHLQILTSLGPPKVFTDGGLIRGQQGRPGEDAVQYKLHIVDRVIVIDKNGQYTKDAFVARATMQVGAGEPQDCESAVIYMTIDDGDEIPYGHIASISLDEEGPTKNIYVEMYSYDGGVLVDSVEVPVLYEAQDGRDGARGPKGDGSGTTYAFQRKNSVSSIDPPQTGAHPSGPWTSIPYGVDVEHQYEYVSQCTTTTQDGVTTYGMWSTPVIWAKYGNDGDDANVTSDNVFLAISDGGTKFGCFTSQDGKLYINANYINTGELTVSNTSGTIFRADVGAGAVTMANFTVLQDRIYSGSHSLFVSQQPGVFIGSTGISIDRYFRVNDTGGFISGWMIGEDRLHKVTKDTNVVANFLHADGSKSFGNLKDNANADFSQRLFSQSTDPSLTWTGDDEDTFEYSLWHNTSTNSTSYWNTTTKRWVSYSVPIQVFYIGISGGAVRHNIFYGSATTIETYHFGDYWVKNSGNTIQSNDPIMFCVRDSSGDGYDQDDWVLANGESTGIYAGAAISAAYRKTSLVDPSVMSPVRFYAGAENADAPSSARFVVCDDGSLFATGASISGVLNAGDGSAIGDWVVHDGSLSCRNSFGSDDTMVILASTGVLVGTTTPATSVNKSIEISMDDQLNPMIGLKNSTGFGNDLTIKYVQYVRDVTLSPLLPPVVYKENQLLFSKYGSENTAIVIDAGVTSNNYQTGNGVELGVKINGERANGVTGWLQYNTGSGTRYALFIRGLLITTGGSLNVESNPYNIHNYI